MMNRKTALSIIMIGLLAANVAFALPGFTSEPTKSSVDRCVAEVDSNADFTNAASVVHNVKAEDRRVSGHKLRIQTLVFGEDRETVIREYAAACAVDGQDQIRRFNIRQRAR
jgi:hypothetical protein